LTPLTNLTSLDIGGADFNSDLEERIETLIRHLTNIKRLVMFDVSEFTFRTVMRLMPGLKKLQILRIACCPCVVLIFFSIKN